MVKIKIKNKTKTLHIPVTEQQHAETGARAEQLRISVSSYIRMLIQKDLLGENK